MNILKNEKGVTILALTITVIVMVIITGTLIYNANNQLHIKKIDNLYSDIEQIRDKVSQYYIKYGKLPVKGRYCTANELTEILKQNGAGQTKTQNDLLDINDKKDSAELTYYVIDLSKLDNLTLYYGSKFKDWEPNVEIDQETEEEIYSSSTEEQDLYIINEKSQQIYYPKGITVENKFYYAHKVDLNESNSAELEVINIPEIVVSRAIFEDTQEDGKMHVAKDSRNSIKVSFDVKIPNSNELTNVLYAFKTKINTDYDLERPDAFESCNSMAIDEDDDDDNNKTYHIYIVSPKLSAETYYLWIRIEDKEGNEVITRKDINQENQFLDGIDNEISIVEEQIELSTENLERRVEVSIKYNPEILENISYGEGEYLEDARHNVNAIDINTEYETDENGNRIYTLVVTKNEYVFVTARDGLGNNTSAYVEVQLDMLKPSSTVNEETSFATGKGMIDIIWLQGATNKPSIPQVANIPNVVEGMTPVTWSLSGTSWIEDETAKSTWYNYNTTSKQWANVTDTNGSYFVWIPRFAYRITYYDEDDTTNSVPTGYYDGFGMWNAETKEVKYSFSDEITAITYKSKSYIVHNAFLNNADNGGGFGIKNEATLVDGITGIWVSKYEMSENSSGSPVSLPDKDTWRRIGVGDCYTNSLNYNSNLKSHLMKNSEWGAVAYLAHSQYGLNGEEVWINNYYDSGTYKTGQAAKNEKDEGRSTSTNTYNLADSYGNPLGPLASSTHNIYGIYDLSGGASEYLAAYNKNYSGTYFTDESYGEKMIDVAKSESSYISTKYITAYSGTNNDHGTDIYSVGITGDATKEVYKGNGSNNWNSDYSGFLNSDTPFLVRGGATAYGAYAGLFFSYASIGHNYSDSTFRIVLVP